MNKKSVFLISSLCTALSLTACESENSQQSSDTIGGRVTAPNGIVAKSFSDDPIYSNILDALLPTAAAQVTGLSPVQNAHVELIRIDDDGNQVGGVLAQGVTNSDGWYHMETGVHGIPPSGDLVVQVRGSGDARLRGFYTSIAPHISPVTEYIVDEIIALENIELKNVNILAINDLQSQISYGSDISIDFSSALSVSDARKLISENPEVDQKIAATINVASTGLPINMTEYRATSTITQITCGNSTQGGWSYEFTDSTMTLRGTDTFIQSPSGCSLGSAEETLSFEVSSLSSDFDIPFNCSSYPVCSESDFNKQLTGVDTDGRQFTSQYFYDGASRELTYIKHVPENKFIEVISITPIETP